jgi:3-oxoadipate enol-lactonase
MPQAQVNGVRIYYELHGQGPREPAVLAMGLGTDANGWERVLPALSADRRVLVLDNRGVGRSDKPPGPYTTALLASDLAGVMDDAGIEHAHVAGVSLGGMIVQEFALSFPARVRSLALVATYAKPDQAMMQMADAGAAVGSGTSLKVGAMLRAIAEGAANLDFGQIFGFLMPRVFTREFLANEAAYLGAFYGRSLEYGLSVEGFAGQVAAALGHDTTARLASLRVPTLVVTGTADRLIAPHHSQTLASLIAGARLLEIEGAPHGLNLEGPERLSGPLASWFAENDAKS